MKTNQKRDESPKQTSRRKRETLRERVHRHISDINSKITDDDIKNVRTELEIRGETAPQNPERGTVGATNEENKPQERNSRKQKKENQTKNRKTTPWDLFSEGYD